MIDHRALLAKYINLVLGEEGITFIYDYLKEEGFTDEEWAELCAVNQEVIDARPKYART